jgi:hypothetical protein
MRCGFADTQCILTLPWRYVEAHLARDNQPLKRAWIPGSFVAVLPSRNLW